MKDEKGQTLLIVVLVMVVALTVGLSVASRSVTNLRVATEQENSQAAFSAAEAGIEKGLQSSATGPIITPGQQDTIGTATIQQTVVTHVGGGPELLVNNVDEDDGADVWLVDHKTDGSLDFLSGWHTSTLSGNGSLTVYWGASLCSSNSEAAIEIIVLSGTQISPVVTRYTADPCTSTERGVQNNFGTVDGREGYLVAGAFPNFAYRKKITIPLGASGGILVRIIPLYANTRIAVRGCDWDATPTQLTDPTICHVFPLQGKTVESTGTSGSTVRKITYNQQYPKLPAEFFQYVLFSP